MEGLLNKERTKWDFLDWDCEFLWRNFAHEQHAKAPEGAAAGAGTGVVLGGALGWLVGIGSLAIPGIGHYMTDGPIMAALAGAGIGATAGGVAGGLIGMGMPDYEAKRYEGKVKGLPRDA